MTQKERNELKKFLVEGSKLADKMSTQIPEGTSTHLVVMACSYFLANILHIHKGVNVEELMDVVKAAVGLLRNAMKDREKQLAEQHEQGN
jgi:hypothetical protein